MAASSSSYDNLTGDDLTGDDVLGVIRGLIRDVPDFPKPGIVFRDITPALGDAAAFQGMIAAMAEPFRDARIDRVVGIEARGFLLGAPLAIELGVGFAPVRKAGKLAERDVRRRLRAGVCGGHDRDAPGRAGGR